MSISRKLTGDLGSPYWIALLGGTGSDITGGVTVDSGGNIIAVGTTASDGAGGSDGLIAKYNSAGTLQWDRTLGGTGTDEFNSVTVDTAGNVIVVGQTTSDGVGSDDVLIAKYNSAGTLQWDLTLGQSGSDVGEGVAVDSANNIYVVGRSTVGSGGNDGLIAKYNSAGTLQWTRALGASGTEVLAGVAVDSTGALIVSGYTTSEGAGGTDILTAKLPPDGSGLGKYGNLIYQSTAQSSAGAVLTNEVAVLTDAPAVLTNVVAVLTDASAVLTEEFFRV